MSDKKKDELYSLIAILIVCLPIALTPLVTILLKMAFKSKVYDKLVVAAPHIQYGILTILVFSAVVLIFTILIKKSFRNDNDYRKNIQNIIDEENKDEEEDKTGVEMFALGGVILLAVLTASGII